MTSDSGKDAVGGGADPRHQPGRLRARDAGLRRTRAIVAGVAAGAVGLSGLLSVVAAQAFKGHPQRATTTRAKTQTHTRARAPSVSVPGPQSVPSIAGDPAPLQPPAQPPAAATPQPSAPEPAPEPQTSGGS